MTSKTQPPELIFVVLNFVALDDCTRHAPFAIERKRSGNRHQSDRNREISSLGSLILRLIVKDTVNKLKMPDIEPCVHVIFRLTTFTYCGKFPWGANFVTATAVTKISIGYITRWRSLRDLHTEGRRPEAV